MRTKGTNMAKTDNRDSEQDEEATRLLFDWIELVMYIVASLPDVGDEDRRALGTKTKELQDELSKIFGC